MVFGAVLQATGVLKSITDNFIKRVNSVLGLIGSTVGTCLAFNVLASDFNTLRSLFQVRCLLNLMKSKT